MKRNWYYLLLGIFLLTQAALAGWRPGEMLVKVKNLDANQRITLAQERFTIDQVLGSDMTILATPQEYDRLIQLGFQPEVVIPSMEEHSRQLLNSLEFANFHDYNSTLSLVDSLLLEFPNLIYKKSYGYSMSGRELYAVRISDNAQIDENEPEISFDGCHHGDEIMGSEVIILLMRDLCVQYGNNPQITDLVNNREIWIYPFINPDGRQALVRYNNNGVDLNRDWGYMWDAWGGSPSPFSQVETQSARDWINDNQFVISQTNHGGAEEISYPWSYRPDASPDDAPIDFLAAGYSTNSGYSNLPYGQGYASMYPINGSAKDAFYGIMGSVGWTQEVSFDKTPPTTQIPVYYNYNKPAMLYLIEMADRGIEGMATNANNGQPVPAIIWVSSTSHNYWPVYTDPEVGDFHKFLLPGTYNLKITANGYQTATVSNVVVIDTGATSVNVQLQPQLGTFAYRVVLTQIPNNNYGDEGYTPACLGSPDNQNYSLGTNGYIVLDMGEPIIDFPGNDLRIIEGDATAEGYSVQVAQAWKGPWHSIGTGSGSQEFDISSTGLQDFQFVRIEDDGIGSSTGADAGFDLDAVEGRLIPTSGPFVMATDYQVYDSLTNNNGKLEAGETADISLMLQNLGVDPAQNVRVKIDCANPLLSIMNDSLWYGNLTSGEQGMVGPYRIAVDPATPHNTKINLNVIIMADGGYSWTHPLALTVLKGAKISANPTAIDFGDVFLNFTAQHQLAISNTGTDTLFINQLSTASSYFWVEENQLAIPAGQQQTIQVKFLPTNVATYTDTLYLSNSDPVNFDYYIALTGQGILAPDIQVTPDSIGAQLLQTDSVIIPVTINNVGPGELIFTTQIGNYPPAARNIEGAGGSDSFGHIWIDSDEPGGPQYNWIELGAGAGTEIPLSGLNSTSSSIPLGFEVPFYQNAYTNLRVCNNGWISFNTFSVSYNNTQLPSTLAPRSMIAPLWDNLNMQTDSHVYYLAEADRFIVQWENIYTATGFGPYTFQLIIYENGNIMMQYKELQGLENAYTVGMQNADGSDGFAIAYNEAYLHELMAILISRRSWVSVNPVGGTIAPGGSAALDLKFKTTSFPLGEFWASLEIRSNDPDEELVAIPIHMVVDSIYTTISTADLLPNSYRLEQNYPNPFNPTTTIRYQIPQSKPVKLDIYNVRGQLVRALIRQQQNAGYHVVKWDGRNDQGNLVSSGLYFYKIQAGSFSQTRRMMLLK